MSLSTTIPGYPDWFVHPLNKNQRRYLEKRAASEQRRRDLWSKKVQAYDRLESAVRKVFSFVGTLSFDAPEFQELERALAKAALARYEHEGDV